MKNLSVAERFLTSRSVRIVSDTRLVLRRAVGRTAEVSKGIEGGTDGSDTHRWVLKLLIALRAGLDRL